MAAPEPHPRAAPMPPRPHALPTTTRGTTVRTLSKRDRARPVRGTVYASSQVRVRCAWPHPEPHLHYRSHTCVTFLFSMPGIEPTDTSPRQTTCNDSWTSRRRPCGGAHRAQRCALLPAVDWEVRIPSKRVVARDGGLEPMIRCTPTKNGRASRAIRPSSVHMRPFLVTNSDHPFLKQGYRRSRARRYTGPAESLR